MMNPQEDLRNKDPLDLVPRWFEMLKELRNGTISYIQLIKREQIRPPVRPVCRRLGVAKLSDIVSEDILYRAVVQVAEAQSRGLKSKPDDGRVGLDGMGMSGMPETMHGMPYGRETRMSLDSIGAVGAHVQSALNREARMSFDSNIYSPHQSYDADDFLDDGNFDQSRLLPAPNKVEPPKKANFYDLLNAILTVKASHGRVKRMSKLTEETGISEETLVLAVQRVCNILGCYRLDPSISNDAIMRALKLFVDSLPLEEQQYMYAGGPTGVGGPGQMFGASSGTGMGGVGLGNDPFGRNAGGSGGFSGIGSLSGKGGVPPQQFPGPGGLTNPMDPSMSMGASGFIPRRNGDESPKPPSGKHLMMGGGSGALPGTVPGSGPNNMRNVNFGPNGQPLGIPGQPLGGQGPGQGGRGIVGSGSGRMYPNNVTLIEDPQVMFQQQEAKRLQQQQRLDYLSQQQQQQPMSMQPPLPPQMVPGRMGVGLSAIQQQQRLDNLKRRSLDSVLHQQAGNTAYSSYGSSFRTPTTPGAGFGYQPGMPMPLPIPRQIGKPGSYGIMGGSPMGPNMGLAGRSTPVAGSIGGVGQFGDPNNAGMMVGNQQVMGTAGVTVIASGKTFWDVTYDLLVLCCDSAKSTDESLGKIFELVNIVETCSAQAPPTAMALVLDVVVERALRVLTDRVPASQSSSSSSSSSTMFIALVDDCINVITNTVSPLLDRFSTGLNSKTAQLLKLLQGFRGWCVADGQKVLGNTGDNRRGTVAGEEESEALAQEVEPASSTVVVLPSLDGLSWEENGDAVLTEIAQRQQGAQGWPDVIEHIRFRLELILETNQPGSSVATHGSSALNMADSSGEVELVALFPEVDKSADSLKLLRCDTLNRLYELESQLSNSVVAETALAVLREIVNDARNAIQTHVSRIRKAVANGAESNVLEAFGAHLLAPHLDRRWTYDSAGPGGGEGAGAPNVVAALNGAENAGDSPQATIARQLAKLSADAELLCKIGERLADSLARSIETARRNRDSIAIFTQLATLRSQVSKSIYDEGNSRKNVLSFLEGLLSRSGYSVVGLSAGFGRSAAAYANSLPPTLTAGVPLSALVSPTAPGSSDLWASDVGVVHFIDDDAPVGPTPCSIAVSATMSMYRAQLLKSFLQIDDSGKARDFIALVHAFARVHNLISGGSDGGFVRLQQNVPDVLSSYAWTVIAIHFLVKFQYLPNLLGKNQPQQASGEQLCGGVDVAFSSAHQLKGEESGESAAVEGSVEKLAGASLLQLLHAFFKYMAFEVDVSGSVLTLRGAGEVIPKSVWGRGRAAGWRLSVEDPFERADSRRPTDLGASLSREGQIEVFKIVRRAAFATHALLHMSPEEAFRQLPSLFTRRLLLGLAKVGGYVGAIVFPVALNESSEGVAAAGNGSAPGKSQSEKDERQRHIDEYLQHQQQQQNSMASAFMAFQHQQQSSVGALDQEQQQFRFNNSDRRQQLLNNRRANGNNSDSEDGPEGYTGGNFSGLMGFASRALDGSNKDEGIAGHSISENASMSHSRADSLDRLMAGPEDSGSIADKWSKPGTTGNELDGLVDRSKLGAFGDFSSFGSSLMDAMTFGGPGSVNVNNSSAGQQQSEGPRDLYAQTFAVESLAPAGSLGSLSALSAGNADMWNGFLSGGSTSGTGVNNNAAVGLAGVQQQQTKTAGDDGSLAFWANGSTGGSAQEDTKNGLPLPPGLSQQGQR